MDPQSQGLEEVCDLIVWQGVQCLTVDSMSASRFGHQTNDRTRIFIREIPGWPSWSSCSILSLPCGGITTQEPQRIHPSCRLSSSLRFW